MMIGSVHCSRELLDRSCDVGKWKHDGSRNSLCNMWKPLVILMHFFLQAMQT